LLINDPLKRNAEAMPDKIGVISSNNRYSYSYLYEKSKCISNYLVERGIPKGSMISVHLPNIIETVISIYGILDAGCAFSIINPSTPIIKLKFILERTKSRIIITNDPEKVGQALNDHIKKNLSAIIYTEKIETTDIKGVKLEELAQIIDARPEFSLSRNVIDMDLASVIFTSGSTGLPKGVMMTHRNMVSASDSITSYLRNHDRDTILNVLPLSFDYGLYQLLMTFCFGGTLILEEDFIFPHKPLMMIGEHKVTGFPIVPSIGAILLKLKRVDEYDLSSLRYITNTAQALPLKIIEGLRSIMPNVDIYLMYGLTECKRVSYLPPDLVEKKPTSVGKAMPNVETFLVDENGNRVNEPHIEGELVIRGSNIMVGYLGEPLDTSRIIKEGNHPGDRLLYSGDVFEMDEDGDLFFRRRKDDILKVLGEKVSPLEIETVINRMENVNEVGVIGVENELLGNEIVAFVSTLKYVQKDDIINHCADHIEKKFLPKRIFFLNELPKNQNGKIDKRVLREYLKDQ